MTYDCQLCGYIQLDNLYDCIKKQRYEEHLKSHNHKLRILLDDTNIALTMKKCRDTIRKDRSEGCLLCRYMPAESANYRFSMNRHMLSKGHIIKVNTHKEFYKDRMSPVCRGPVTKMEIIPSILISRPANISIYKEQLQNESNDSIALLLNQKIQSIENSQNIFTLLAKAKPKPSKVDL